jgi:hypothetical protein
MKTMVFESIMRHLKLNLPTLLLVEISQRRIWEGLEKLFFLSFKAWQIINL